MNSYANQSLINFSTLFCILLLSVSVISCAAAPQYDAVADAQLTSLQKEVDTQIVQFIALSRQSDNNSLKIGSYYQNIDFYNKVDTDMTSLELRMEATPDAATKNLPQLFDNLRKQLKNIQNAHQKEGNLSEVIWQVTRNQLNAQFAVLLTYEISLKGVSSPSSSSTQSVSTTTASAKAPAN